MTCARNVRGDLRTGRLTYRKTDRDDLPLVSGPLVLVRMHPFASLAHHAWEVLSFTSYTDRTRGSTTDGPELPDRNQSSVEGDGVGPGPSE